MSQNPTQLFKILNKLPRFGVGRKVTRDVWETTETKRKPTLNYWTIKKVVPHSNLKTGEAYGILYLRGTHKEKLRQVTNEQKRQWKLLPRHY